MLAVAGALATSYYVGGRIEQAIEQTADSWAEGSGVTVQVMDYERGIISSKATTLWSIATEDDTYEITAKHDILHGPWPMGKAAKVVSRFLLPEGTDPALVKALSSAHRWNGRHWRTGRAQPPTTWSHPASRQRLKMVQP